jgi:ribosomal protein S18 acetylase RimI-like enzyme
VQTIINLAPEHYPWDLLLLADPSRELVEDYIKVSIVLGLQNAGEIAGVIVVTPLSPTSWEIKNLATRPKHQGKGLGTTLLKEALKACAERGASEVWIGTGNSSIKQLKLYQKIGFRMVAIDRDFFMRNYNEPIFEDGIQCRDMIRLVHHLQEPQRHVP